jgi:hypothetical protein
LNLQAKIHRTAKTRFKLFGLKASRPSLWFSSGLLKAQRSRLKPVFILKSRAWFLFSQINKKSAFVPR